MDQRPQPGLTTVLELQPQDDLASLRHRLRTVGAGRVVLDLPWDVQCLSRPVDFDLLIRAADAAHI